MVQPSRDRTRISINPQEIVTVPFTRNRNLRGLKEPTLSGHKLQLTTKIKYLGLTLYQDLALTAQLKNAMNKDYTASFSAHDN